MTDALLLTVERTSRVSAALMALGALLVFGALWVGNSKLSKLNTEVTALELRAGQIKSEREAASNQLQKLQLEVSSLRQALSASRDAIAAFHSRDYEEAVRLYELALSADPGNVYIMNLKAYSLFKLGRVQEAITFQATALQKDNTYAWGYFDLARFQCAAGDKVSAGKSIALAIAKESRFRELAQQDGEFRRLCGQLAVPK
jgi:tetratricopeptide (TPR) repeat protein